MTCRPPPGQWGLPTPPPIPPHHHGPPPGSLRDLAVIVVILIVVAALSARRKPAVVVARPAVSPGVRRARRLLAALAAGTGALVLLPGQLAVVALVVLAILWKLAGKIS